MSVLACDRNGCYKIMCDRYSSEFGYICNECFEELIESNLIIESFMRTPKGNNYLIQDKESRIMMLNKEFPSRK